MAPKRGKAAEAPARSAAAEPRALYEVLGVLPGATQAEVQRAFKLRAREVHPDKNPGEAGAKEAFQKLQKAYEVIRDPERRRRYDEMGDEGDGEMTSAEIVRWFRARFKPVTAEDLDAYATSYRGSAAEKADVAAFVRQKQGDLSLLLEVIVCSEPDDADRFVDMALGLVADGELPEALRGAIEASAPELKKRAEALRRRNERERKAVERKQASSGASSLEELAAAIRGRQHARGANSVVDRLEVRYGGASSGPSAASGARAARKRPAAVAGLDVAGAGPVPLADPEGPASSERGDGAPPGATAGRLRRLKRGAS